MAVNESPKPNEKPRKFPFTAAQLVALFLGVGGAFVDYRFDIYGKEHIPIVFYCTLIGVAFGLHKLEELTKK